MKDGMIQQEADIVQPRNLFKPGSWLSKIDFINHLILFNNVIISVLAEKDGGKTSFGTLLQQNLERQIKAIPLTIKVPCNREILIEEIASRLHLNFDLNTNFDSLVTQVNERKAQILLILDDAQNISEDFMKEMMVAVKKQGEFGFFHICLLSDYSLVATLNLLAVNHLTNLIHNIELGPLTESEVRTYVLQRAMASRLINKPLTEVQYKQFYQMTKGQLAKINNHMEEYVAKCLTITTPNDTRKIKKVGIAITAVVAVGISYIYVNNFFTGLHLSDTLQSKNSVDLTLSSEQTMLSSYVPSLEEFPKEFLQAKISTGQDLDLLAKEEINQVLANGYQASDSVAAIMPSQRQPASDEPKKTAVLESRLEPIQLVKETTKPIRMTNNQFTIQLVASHKQSDVLRFRKNNKLLANAKIRHFTNRHGSWYILTIGEFDNRLIAQTHISKLPGELAKFKPWIRPVNGLNQIG